MLLLFTTSLINGECVDTFTCLLYFSYSKKLTSFGELFKKNILFFATQTNFLNNFLHFFGFPYAWYHLWIAKMLYYLFVSMFVLITVHRIVKETHLTSSVLFSENHQKHLKMINIYKKMLVSLNIFTKHKYFQVFKFLFFMNHSKVY